MKFLSDLMSTILEFFYTYTGNWGLAIIGLTLVARLALWPLTHRQTKSMRRMQELQPDLNKLQKKYKGNPEKMNKEVMALYKKHGVNPMGGCLPLLLQFPILIALFGVLRAMEYPAGEGVFLWLPDLSLPDPFYILPILTALTTFITQKQMATDPKQSQMMMFMPLMIGWFASRFASGLALYLVTSNIFGILQHLLAGRQPGMKGELVPDENN